jgi:hypothetical protein
MSSAIITAGTVISIGTTAATASSDTYTAIGEVVSFDGPGGSASVIDVSHLGSTAREKRKGLKDSGQFSITVNRIFSDVGQTALITAQDEDEPYNVKVLYPSGHIHYLKALVMEFKITGGGVDDVLRGTVTFEITGAVTQVNPS